MKSVGQVAAFLLALPCAWAGPASTNSASSTRPAEMIVSDKDRQHWSFRPLSEPSVPIVENRRLARGPVDRFILASLEKKRLSYATEASPRQIARRLYFDLIGLPPAPAQIEAFVRAFSKDPGGAVSRLVDELLASPHYGERWARHWLDVARYADSDGQESDADRPTAYHYRDFVIRSLNDDRAFDLFVRWQIAGDELEPDEPEAVAATGFIAAGTHAALPDNLMEEERVRTRFNELDDMIATTGSALLGLTLGCARCHDHKYDPVPRRDYYRMLSAFNGGDRAELPLVPMEQARRHRELEAQWKKDSEAARQNLESFVRDARRRHEKQARQSKVDALKASAGEKELLVTGTDTLQVKEVNKKFSKELKVEDKDLRPFLAEEERAEWDRREQTLKEVNQRKPKSLPTAFGFADFGSKPRETFLLARGDFRAKSEPVELGFLSVLTRGRQPSDYWAAARLNARRADSTQQRRALANWMTDLDQGAGALLARVIVNRVWQHHFGHGLVRTVNDFGARSDPPTHPELLEWLSHEFVKGGWKLKPLHRLMMNSSVYLQGTTMNAEGARLDPDNRLLWRRRPLRLEAEVLRDSILAVSGTLQLKMYGPAVKAPIPVEAIQARNMKDPYPKDLRDTSETRRRSIYLFHKRVVQQPLMQAFDGPDAQASCGRRENTTVAPQALALLNDRFVRTRAADFAKRIGSEAGESLEGQVRSAWLMALGRIPSGTELEVGVTFLRSQFEQRFSRDPAKAPSEIRHLALADFCQAIFAFNEFIYVD